MIDIDTKKLNSLSNQLDIVRNDIKTLNSINNEYFEQGNTLTVTVSSNLYGTLSNQTIKTYLYSDKYIVPLLEDYKNKDEQINKELLDIIQGGNY